VAFAAVQRKGKAATSVTTLSIGAGDGWATPTSGNLLVLTANSDATVSTPSGWTAGPSVIDGNGAYIFYKVSAGTESTVTVTPGSSANTSMTVAEYSGNAASPFDTSNTSTIAGSSGNTTTSVSVTTTQSGDLIVAAALIHSAIGANPTSPTWTNSFVNQVSASSGVTSPSCDSFVAELIAGAAGSYSTSASWTNNANDRQELVIAFTAAPTPAAGATAPVVVATGPGRISPTGSWSPFPYSVTAQTYALSFTGSVTPTGALQKAATKPDLAGSVTPTGALAKQANKALSGSVTPTGVLTTVKVVLRAFAGSVTATGVLTKQANKALAGSVTATGTLTKQVAKALAGSVTPPGALDKAVAKALAGSVTPTGVLTTTKVLLRSFAGSVTPTGVLTRQANKALAGSVTPRGALAKAVTKALSGAVAAVGSLAKFVTKPFAGRSTPTGALAATPVGATQNATSTATLTAVNTSTSTASAGRTSTPGVSPKATSTPSVSDG
jgi:hypothetical protein